MSWLHRLQPGRLARGPFLERQRAHPSCSPVVRAVTGALGCARLAPQSPGSLPSLGRVIQHPAHTPTRHPPSRKTLLLAPPRIKKTRRDLQILPSSRFRLRDFENKAERKWRAWGFLLPRRAVSVSGFTSGLEAMLEQPKT